MSSFHLGRNRHPILGEVERLLRRGSDAGYGRGGMMTYMPKETHRVEDEVPTWLTRHETVIGAILAAVAIVLFAVMVPVHTVIYGGNVPVTMLFAAAAVSAPLVSIRRPNTATALFSIATLALPLIMPHDRTVDGPWPWTVPLLITFAVAVATMTSVHGW